MQEVLANSIDLTTYELSLDPHSIFHLLLELDITLVLHERGVPWHILFLVCQLCIEVGMCGAIQRLPLDLPVCGALIGIKESSKTGRSESIHTELFFEKLTETPGPSMLCRQGRSRMPKPICRYLDPKRV
jgi:hypothetical protein